MQQPLAPPHSGGPPSKRHRTQSRLFRILPIGPELRVEELRALLAEQEDMQLLPPIADPDQALDVLSRTNRISRIDVVIVEGEFCEEQHSHLLQVLSRHMRCLVIAPPMYPSETKRLEEAGAYGYCPTAASSQQLVKIMRKIVQGEKYFHPTPTTELKLQLFTKRHPVFFQERLEEQATSINWPLSDIE